MTVVQNLRGSVFKSSSHAGFKNAIGLSRNSAAMYFKSTVVVFFVAVKYMREATPYVKKGSPVSEIGWETPPPESPRLGAGSSDALSSQPCSFHRDRKYIPLKMCYVTRSLASADPENR